MIKTRVIHSTQTKLPVRIKAKFGGVSIAYPYKPERSLIENHVAAAMDMIATAQLRVCWQDIRYGIDGQDYIFCWETHAPEYETVWNKWNTPQHTQPEGTQS